MVVAIQRYHAVGGSPEEPPNQGLVPAIPGAAHSIPGRLLCLLSGLAAPAHVRRDKDAKALPVQAQPFTVRPLLAPPHPSHPEQP